MSISIRPVSTPNFIDTNKVLAQNRVVLQDAERIGAPLSSAQAIQSATSQHQPAGHASGFSTNVNAHYA